MALRRPAGSVCFTERMPPVTAPARRIRLHALVSAGCCVALGLGLQLLDRSPLVDVLGSMLYVVAFGLVVLLAWPALPAVVIASIALAIAVGVELLQLTPIPAAVVDAVPAARLLFGSAFDLWDLAAYLGGGVALYVLVRVITRGYGTLRRVGEQVDAVGEVAVERGERVGLRVAPAHEHPTVAQHERAGCPVASERVEVDRGRVEVHGLALGDAALHRGRAEGALLGDGLGGDALARRPLRAHHASRVPHAAGLVEQQHAEPPHSSDRRHAGGPRDPQHAALGHELRERLLTRARRAQVRDGVGQELPGACDRRPRGIRPGESGPGASGAGPAASVISTCRSSSSSARPYASATSGCSNRTRSPPSSTSTSKASSSRRERPERRPQQLAQLVLARQPHGVGERDGVERPLGRAVEREDRAGRVAPRLDRHLAHGEDVGLGLRLDVRRAGRAGSGRPTPDATRGPHRGGRARAPG